MDSTSIEYKDGKLACPRCGEPRLGIQFKVELAANADWDEVNLQMLGCAACGFESAGLYREERRGGLGSEIWRHDSFAVTATELARLRQAMEQCPDRKNRHCSCPSHQLLSAWVTEAG